MIYRADGHKQHNSLTNTQWQPRCRWHTYHYKSSEVAGWKDGTESEREEERERERETCKGREKDGLCGTVKKRRVTLLFKIYIYDMNGARSLLWHVASLLLAAAFKRWDGFVRHTCMMTRDGEDEYFCTIFTTKQQINVRSRVTVAAVEVAFPVSSYTHKLHTVRRSPVQICFIAASARVSACAFFFAPL